MSIDLSESNDVETRLLESMIRNCRVNLASVSKETGLKYSSLQIRFKRLKERGLFDVKPMVSTKLAGYIGAVVRFRAEHKERMVDFLSKCNRVIGLMENDNGEIIALMYGRSKVEINTIVSSISLHGDGISEFSIEYGKLPLTLLIPLKKSEVCLNECILKETIGSICQSCLPYLRLKNNGKSKNH